jgi:predicted peptidase
VFSFHLCLLIAGVAMMSGTSELVPRTLELEDGSEVRYTLSLPDDLDSDRPVPLVLALHYSWEGELPTYYGMTFLIRLAAPALEELGAIIVAPDCPERDWHHPRSKQAIWAILEQVQSEHAVDMDRRMITGFSLGGMGTWNIVAEHADTFSAAIPIATAPTVVPEDSTVWTEYRRFLDEGTVHWRESLSTIPFFVIHSRDDELIPFATVVGAIENLVARGASIEFLAIDGRGHYDIEEYVDPLASAVDWIRAIWSGG